MKFVAMKRLRAEEIAGVMRPPVDEATLAEARVIVDSVRERGEAAIREHAMRFGERSPGDALVLGKAEMRTALDGLDPADRTALEGVAARIERFARRQRGAIGDVTLTIPGGEAGHTVTPVQSAGCYAPNGRHPLPSSVLMTAITARAAGCRRVVVASPGADPVMLAAAAIAQADEFLAVGGAHAIAAMAHGFEGFSRCDVIAGPGNRWVTAAKQLVSGVAGIDMLAGPSELLVLADEQADPGVIAADLLAQAEHDTDACAMLVTTSESIAETVDRELVRMLPGLTTRDTAEHALGNGFTCVVGSIEEGISVVDRVSPEHLEIMTADAGSLSARIQNAGGVFVGARSAEVFGDYGAGPNHTLPTGGTARFRAGLSVMDFLRLRTWLRIDDPAAAGVMIDQTERLARMEGLAGHEASARARRPRTAHPSVT